nr:alpha/beta hydrolase [uncultured Undibacterium sp.]
MSVSWVPRIAAIKSINFDNTQSLSSANYIGLVDAWLHDGRLETLKEKEYTTGDNRWLCAKFKLINAKVHNTEVRRFFLHRILAEQIDENGARTTEKHRETKCRNGKIGANAEQLKPLKDALVQENGPPKDRVAYTYKQVNGVALQTHVFPAKDPSKLSPAFIWFHGGSLNTGHWNYCSVLCRSLQAEGFVVIQVEYRTSQRFDGTPLDALSDVYSVGDWTIKNANKLHINPKQIMTGGFSSGASLASQWQY